MTRSFDMSGRVCLITGATSGIGFETAIQLARRGATVLLAGPDEHEAGRALDRLRRGVPGAAGQAYAADLSRMDEVRGLANRVSSEHEQLHVLVNNAGIFANEHRLTEDGYESTLAVNFLAPFLLTALLHPRLCSCEDGRVVNVSSIAHLGASIDLDDLHFERRRYHGYFAYAASKLALLCVTRALARRHPPPAPSINALHPGVVGTPLVAGAGLPGRLLGWARPLLRSPARGAKTSVHLACAPELRGVSGGYFVDARQRTPGAAARDDALAERLFSFAVELTDAPW